MKLAKSLLLGSAAGFVAVAGASAADLPSRKAAPVAFVKICDAYGAGFFYIPGTDTCLRVSGRVRGEYTYIPAGNIVGVGANAFPTVTKATGGTAANVYNIAPTFQIAREAIDQSGFLARGVAILDARTQTEFGTARTYIAIRGQNATGLYANNALTGTLAGAALGGASITVEQAVIQFAGFSFGRTSENFAFMPSYNFISHNWASFPSGINQLTYTATFGGGFSGTISLEDRQGLSASANPTGLYVGVSPNIFNPTGSLTFQPAGVPLLGSSVTAVNGPSTWPALTGNVRLDQAWGAVQVMGQVLENTAVVTGANSYFAQTIGGITPAANSANPLLVTGGNPGDKLAKIGYAVGAGVKINLPFIAAGDVLNLTGAYAKGDMDELQTYSTSARLANIGKEFNGLQRTDRNLYVFPTAACSPGQPAGTVLAGAAAAVATSTTCGAASEETRGYSFGGIFTHYFTPNIRANVLASYINITPGKVTQNTDWVLGGLSKSSMYEVGSSIIYSPAKDFDIGLEVTYAKLRQRLTGENGAAPTSVYVASNQSGVANTGGLLPNNVVATPVLPFKVSPNMIQTRLRAERTF